MKSNADMRSSKKLVYIQNVNTMCFAKSETFFIFQLSTFFSVKGFTPNVMLTCNSFYYRYKLRVHVNLISLNTLVSLHFWGEYNTDMKNAHWVHAGTYCNVFSYIWQINDNVCQHFLARDANSLYIMKRRIRWFLNIVWNYESLALAFLLCGWFSPVLPAINKLTWQQPINVWINVHGWILPFQFPPGSIAQDLIYLLISTLLSLWSKETHVDCWAENRFPPPCIPQTTLAP